MTEYKENTSVMDTDEIDLQNLDVRFNNPFMEYAANQMTNATIKDDEGVGRKRQRSWEQTASARKRSASAATRRLKLAAPKQQIKRLLYGNNPYWNTRTRYAEAPHMRHYYKRIGLKVPKYVSKNITYYPTQYTAPYFKYQRYKKYYRR